MKAVAVAVTAMVSFVLFAITGWVMNLITVVESSDQGITVGLAVRVLGIFVAPIGAIIGWF